MSGTTATLPYDITKLAGAAARILYAPHDTVAIPTTLADVFAQVAPYAPMTGWEDLGATSGPFTMDRNLTVAGYKIEQEQTDLLEQPTDLTRTFKTAVAEISQTTLAILEEGTVNAQAAAAGVSAATQIGVGNVTDLTAYRACFVTSRQIVQGAVVEGVGGLTRGRFLAFIALYVTLTTDNATWSFGKAALSSATLTWKLNPDPGVTDPAQSQGFWVDETAGTLTV